MEVARRVGMRRSASARFIGVLACALAARGAPAQGIQAAQMAPGFTYTLRVTGSSPSAMPGVTGGPGSQGYTGRASVTPSRGRLDITDGGIDNLFSKGDYLLFDSTDAVIVHPAQRQFMVVSAATPNEMLARLESLGVELRLSDEKVALDSLGPGDTIVGTPTRRFRLTMAFNMAMDAGALQQRLGSETVTDYWVGVVPGLPSNPLLRSNGIAGAGLIGMFKTLSARVDSLSRRMGHTVALRTVSTTRINAGPGQMIESRQSSEVADLKRAPVDPALLVLPSSFVAVPLPGAPPASAADGAKWKAAPTGS